jgi:hypothetical protein
MSISEKLTQIAENEQKVYDAGKKAEYDAFWDNHQDYGNRTDYYCGFAGWRTFNPKYDMTVTSAYMMFRGCMLEDIGEALRHSGKKIYVDAKKANPMYMFASCPNLKIIDEVYFTTPFAGITSTFAWSSKLEEIRQPILVDESTTYNGGLDSLHELREVRFEGTIAKSGLNLQWSTKLSKASIESVINCLSTTTSGLSVTLSKAAVNKAFETSEGANDGATSTEWTTLIGTRSNWTVSLV